ncbi:O-methyltransferase [Ottowia thiooxydans]|uniref:O-methyltransferase n=1 Tax=Ottowia thiooxydans TaxID=219182 RepID=UPI00040D2F7A|nr:O-methyltransferase [Ottowia thiooxydans]
MSGGSSPYHLRLNKSIERNLFIDLLKIVSRHTNISDYWYVGFAGPFSEDFKLIHSALRITKMKSLEIDENVFRRQKFNYSPSFIEYYNKSFKSFLEDEFYQSHKGEANAITWLDYADAKQTLPQLQEFRELVANSSPNDVIKITLNANPATLKGPDKVASFKSRMSRFSPVNLVEENLLAANFPNTLMKCIKLSLDGIASGRKIHFHPVASFIYQDTNNKMLTVTGIVLNNNDAETISAFEKNTRLAHWKFHNTSWENPRAIRVPSLSIKERIELDSHLPCDDKNRGLFLKSTLNFHPEETEDAGIAALENYAEYYRSYSLFTKIVV